MSKASSRERFIRLFFILFVRLTLSRGIAQIAREQSSFKWINYTKYLSFSYTANERTKIIELI